MLYNISKDNAITLPGIHFSMNDINKDGLTDITVQAGPFRQEIINTLNQFHTSIAGNSFSFEDHNKDHNLDVIISSGNANALYEYMTGTLNTLSAYEYPRTFVLSLPDNTQPDTTPTQNAQKDNLSQNEEEPINILGFTVEKTTINIAIIATMCICFIVVLIIYMKR